MMKASVGDGDEEAYVMIDYNRVYQGRYLVEKERRQKAAGKGLS